MIKENFNYSDIFWNWKLVSINRMEMWLYLIIIKGKISYKNRKKLVFKTFARF